MQNLAMEMNLAETAFLVPLPGGDFSLRWFTPAAEVALCGHATLASAHALWEEGVLAPEETARFQTKSGLLTAERRNGLIELDFPVTRAEASDAPEGLLESLGITSAAYVGRTRFDYLIEVEDEQVVRNLDPDHARLRKIPVRGVVVTSRSNEDGVDFVSRFFAPGVGVDEDPVTGSAHCALTPYWAERLGRTELLGYQASKRGGFVRVRLEGDRVKLGGNAVTIFRGMLLV